MLGKAAIFCGVSALALIAGSPAHAQDITSVPPGEVVDPAATPVDPDAPAATDEPAEVIVTGIRSSIESAAKIKRNSDSVVDSIVAEDIGKFPDNTVSDALQRVTGIQVQRGGGEAGTVLIRGLPNVQSYINGRETFTGTFRGVALQDIPAELIAGVDVYKSATPEIIEGGVAGLIDIRLRRPFDFAPFEIAGSARGVYADQAGKWGYNGSLVISKTWDVGDGGRFGAMLAGSYNRRRYEDQTVFNFGFSPRANAFNGFAPYLNPATGNPLLFPQTTGAIYNVGDRKRPAINASIQYAPSENLEFWADALWTGYRERFDVNFFIGLPGEAFSPLASYTVVPGTDIVDTLSNINNFTIHSKQAFKRKTDTYQGAAGARWKSGQATLSTEFVYNDSTVKARQVVVDVGYVSPRINYDLNDNGTPRIEVVGADIENPGGGIITLFDNLNLAKSKQYAWHNDIDIDLGQGFVRTFKAGLRFTNRKGSSFGTNPSGAGIPFILTSTLPAEFLNLSPGNILGGRAGIDRFAVPNSDYILDNTDEFRGYAGRPLGDPAYDPNRTFRLKENTYAAYTQLGFASEGSVPVEGVIGVRVVSTDTKLNATQLFNNVATPIVGKSEYTDILPSLSLKMRPLDNLQFRLALAKSVTRPEFDQLNPAVALTQAGATIRGTGSGGNPDLDPIRSNNVDATAEYYFARNGSLTVAAFYRKLDGYVQFFTVDEIQPGIGGVPTTFAITRPRNTDGSLKGVEAQLNYFFTFLPGALSGFGAQVNGTYIDASAFNPIRGEQAPITGVSKYSYNLVAIYEKYGLSARLAYNWRSKFIASYTNDEGRGIGDSISVKPLKFLDFSASYDINKKITVSFDATNLLDETYRDDFVPGIAPRDTRKYDRTFGAGIRFRL